MNNQVAFLKLLKTNGAILLNQKLNSKNRLITEDATFPKQVGLRNFFPLRELKVTLNDLWLYLIIRPIHTFIRVATSNYDIARYTAVPNRPKCKVYSALISWCMFVISNLYSLQHYCSRPVSSVLIYCSFLESCNSSDNYHLHLSIIPSTTEYANMCSQPRICILLATTRIGPWHRVCYYYYYYFQIRTAAFKAYCAIWVRRSNFRHQASPRVSPCESTQRRKVKLWAKNVRVILPKCRGTRYI